MNSVEGFVEGFWSFVTAVFNGYLDMLWDWPVGTILGVFLTLIFIAMVVVLCIAFRERNNRSCNSGSYDSTMDLVSSQSCLNTTIESMNTVIDSTNTTINM
jgi:hypothetical protein